MVPSLLSPSSPGHRRRQGSRSHRHTSPQVARQQVRMAVYGLAHVVHLQHGHSRLNIRTCRGWPRTSVRSSGRSSWLFPSPSRLQASWASSLPVRVRSSTASSSGTCGSAWPEAHGEPLRLGCACRCVLLLAFAFIIGQIGVNVAANSLSAGTISRRPVLALSTSDEALCSVRLSGLRTCHGACLATATLCHLPLGLLALPLEHPQVT